MAITSTFNAQSFSSTGVDLSTTNLTTAFTVGSEEVYLVKSIVVANYDASNAVNVSAQWTDNSNSDTAYWIQKNKAMSAETSYDILGPNMGPVVLHEGDKIKVQADTADRAHVTVTSMKLGRGTGL